MVPFGAVETVQAEGVERGTRVGTRVVVEERKMENRDEVNEKVNERDYEVEMLGSDGTGGGVNVV